MSTQIEPENTLLSPILTEKSSIPINTKLIPKTTVMPTSSTTLSTTTTVPSSTTTATTTTTTPTTTTTTTLKSTTTPTTTSTTATTTTKKPLPKTTTSSSTTTTTTTLKSTTASPTTSSTTVLTTTKKALAKKTNSRRTSLLTKTTTITTEGSPASTSSILSPRKPSGSSSLEGTTSFSNADGAAQVDWIPIVGLGASLIVILLIIFGLFYFRKGIMKKKRASKAVSAVDSVTFNTRSKTSQKSRKKLARTKSAITKSNSNISTGAHSTKRKDSPPKVQFHPLVQIIPRSLTASLIQDPVSLQKEDLRTHKTPRSKLPLSQRR